ncbi:MAG: transcription antitermination factor NusB [Neisseriaceae bacterium]
MRTPRHRSREFALQAIYQKLVNPEYTVSEVINNVIETDAFVEAMDGRKPKVDAAFFEQLVLGVYTGTALYEERIAACLDRSWLEVDWIERAVLLIACHEFIASLETPSPVIINEAIELAKTYGKGDSHRFINGALDKLSGKLRADHGTRLNRSS